MAHLWDDIAVSGEQVRLIEGDCRQYIPALQPVDVVLTDPPYIWWNILMDAPQGAPDMLYWPIHAMVQQWFPLMLARVRVGVWMTTDRKYLPYYDLPGMVRLLWSLPSYQDREPVLVYIGKPPRADVPTAIREGYQYGQDSQSAWWRALLDLCPCDTGVVFDPFCGTGSGLIAAVEAGYQAIGVECDPDIYQACARNVRACLHRQNLLHSGPTGPRSET